MSSIQLRTEIPPMSLRELLALSSVQSVVFGRIRSQLASFEAGRRSRGAIEEDAMDLFQDVMVRALLKESIYRPEEGGIGWVLTMAHRVVCNRCRRLHAKERCGDGLFDVIADLIPAPTIEDRSWVWTIVDGLPSIYRDVLRLRYDCEMTPASIAARLGLPDARAVSDRLYRAKERFRAAVATAHSEDLRSVGWNLCECRRAIPAAPQARRERRHVAPIRKVRS